MDVMPRETTCKTKRSLGISLLGAASLLGSAEAQESAEPPLAAAAAVIESAPLERAYDGTVEAVNQATVSAQTSGRIAEIFYDVDDYVEAGAAIIRFTDVEQRAALRQAQAALDEAEALRREAEEEFRRTTLLFERGASTQREHDRALAAHDTAVARAAAAGSAVATAEQQVEYTLVRAPYAGIVTARQVEIGESVSVGQPLMSGLSLEALRVTVRLPQETAARVREHGAAAVMTETGRVTPTEITVFPFADAATNTFTTRVELPEGRYSLYPGMFVKVAFVIGESRRLLIPTAALLRRSEVTGVYVVGSDGSVRLRQVRVGNAFGERTEVLAGLSEGERVALDPVTAGIYVKSIAARDDG
jgi:RND family efflux transporter MFP subunit